MSHKGERVKVISVFGIDGLHECVPPSDIFCKDREENPLHARARDTDGKRRRQRAMEMNHYSAHGARASEYMTVSQSHSYSNSLCRSRLKDS